MSGTAICAKWFTTVFGPITVRSTSFITASTYVRFFSSIYPSIKVCLHVPTPSQSPSQSLSKFNIVLMVTGGLAGRMDDRPILPVRLPVRLPVTIDMMLNFDGHCDGDEDGVGTCKQYYTPETAICIKWFTTFRALTGFLSGVCSIVPNTSFVTACTQVRFFSIIYFGICAEWFTTFRAHAGFLSGMCSLVNNEVIFRCEHLATNFTVQWFLSGVGSSMSIQCPFVLEFFSTHITLMFSFLLESFHAHCALMFSFLLESFNAHCVLMFRFLLESFNAHCALMFRFLLESFNAHCAPMFKFLLESFQAHCARTFTSWLHLQIKEVSTRESSCGRPQEA